MAPVDHEPLVDGASVSSAGNGNPTAMLRSAAMRLREVADTIDGSARTMRGEVQEPPDPKMVQVVVDAATHIRLTAEALEYVTERSRA